MTDFSEGERICKEILDSGNRGDLDGDVIGFDTETTPAFLSPTDADGKIDTVQIFTCKKETGLLGGSAVAKDISYVFHVRLWRNDRSDNSTDRGLPKSMRQLIESPTIKKAAVNAKSDIALVKKTWQNNFLEPAGFVDPGYLANELCLTSRKMAALSKLSLLLFNKDVDKTFQVANYAVKALRNNKPQIEYAALDAVVHYKLYMRLVELMEEIKGGIDVDKYVLVRCSAKNKTVAYGKVTAVAADIVTVDVTSIIMPGFKLSNHGGDTIEAVADGATTGFDITISKENVLIAVAEHGKWADIDSASGGPVLNGSGVEVNPLFDDLLTRLDPVHGMFRCSDDLRKRHGCHRKFMARLRDGMFNISVDDVKTVKLNLKMRGFSDDDIEQLYLGDFGHFVRRCRRHIPEPTTLVGRLKRVYDYFKGENGIDAKTGDHLYTPKFKKAWKALVKKHAARGCLSDPLDINLYYNIILESGKEVLRCERTTSPLEGFHLHLRRLFNCHVISPRYASLLLAEFIARWNRRARVRARGEGDYGSVDFDVMEIIRDLAAKIGHEEYADVPHADEFEDTGETFFAVKIDLQDPDLLEDGDDAELLGSGGFAVDSDEDDDIEGTNAIDELFHNTRHDHGLVSESEDEEDDDDDSSNDDIDGDDGSSGDGVGDDSSGASNSANGDSAMNNGATKSTTALLSTVSVATSPLRSDDDSERLYLGTHAHSVTKYKPSPSEIEFAEMQGLDFIPVTTVDRMYKDEVKLFKDTYAYFCEWNNGRKLLAAKFACYWNIIVDKMGTGEIPAAAIRRVSPITLLAMHRKVVEYANQEASNHNREALAAMRDLLRDQKPAQGFVPPRRVISAAAAGKSKSTFNAAAAATGESGDEAGSATDAGMQANGVASSQPARPSVAESAASAASSAALLSTTTGNAGSTGTSGSSSASVHKRRKKGGSDLQRRHKQPTSRGSYAGSSAVVSRGIKLCKACGHSSNTSETARLHSIIPNKFGSNCLLAAKCFDGTSGYRTTWVRARSRFNSSHEGSTCSVCCRKDVTSSDVLDHSIAYPKLRALFDLLPKGSHQHLPKLPEGFNPV